MTFTFLQAQGISIGDSLFEASEIKTAKEILSSTKSLQLPSDLIIADAFENNAKTKTISSQEGIPSGWRGLDIGPKTIDHWSTLFQKAHTVFWNGPLGAFEMPQFATGTYAIAKALIESKAKVIIGGGDLVAAIQQMGLQNSFYHLSTCGGAALEFLEFGHLPGIDALTNANSEIKKKD
jgi:phosphoglycerate kinase